MKKRWLLITACIILCCNMVACGKEEVSVPENVSSENVSAESEWSHMDSLDDVYLHPATKDYKDIRTLPDDYHMEQAQADGFFVIGAMVHNDYLYSEFMSHCENKEDAFIRVAQSTEEGDLILTDLLYDSKQDVVYVIHDSTRDQFSSEKDRIISVREFDGIVEYIYHGEIYWTAYNGELNDETFESEDAFAIAFINSASDEDVLKLERALENLDYPDITCDGIPEYEYHASDGTTYQINLGSHWIWKNARAEASFTEDDEIYSIIMEHMDKYGLDESGY